MALGMVSFSDRLPSVIHIKSVPTWRCQERCATFFGGKIRFGVLPFLLFQNWLPKRKASPSSQHHVDEDLRLQVPPVECFSCGDVIPWSHVMKLIWHAYVVSFPLCSHKFCLERNFRKQQKQTEREILLSDRYPLMIHTYPVVNSRCRDIFWNTDKAWLGGGFLNVSIYCLFVTPIWKISNLMSIFSSDGLVKFKDSTTNQVTSGRLRPTFDLKISRRKNPSLRLIQDVSSSVVSPRVDITTHDLDAITVEVWFGWWVFWSDSDQKNHRLRGFLLFFLKAFFLYVQPEHLGKWTPISRDT